MLHDLLASAESSDGKAATDNLSETCEIWNDAVERLCAAFGTAKTGDHLIENQHSSNARCLFSQHFKKCCCRRHNTHVSSNRLKNYRRNAVLILRVAQKIQTGFDVIVG